MAGDTSTVEALALRERPQSLGEEVANSVRNELHLFLALTAFAVPVTASIRRVDEAGIVAARKR